MNNKQSYVLMSLAQETHHMNLTVKEFMELYANIIDVTGKELQTIYDAFKERETFVFPGLGKPISQMSDDAVIAWLISFLNGATFDSKEDIKMYEIFSLERKFRSSKFNDRVEYLLSVL